MAEHIPEFVRAGVNRLRIEARRYDPEAVRAVTGIYRELLDAAMRDAGYRVPGEALKRIEALHGTTTRGLYFRGVL